MKKNVRLPGYIRPERYEIMLRPDLNEFTFTGQETIYLSLEKPTKQITLHSVDLEIESAELIHANKETWAGQISYDVKAETAVFVFPKTLPKGKGELKLIFRGILNDKMRGFYRSRYGVDGVSKHLAVTQFESTDARRAFPCFDEPIHKAIFDVTLMIPKPTVAISNTIESDILEHESGYKVVKFLPTPKMSTYLLAFIVGEFEYIEGRTNNDVLVRVFTTPGKKDQAKFALDVAVKCLEFYEEYFGVDYPLPVLDLIAIPDFAAGAMENWGAVTYRESTLLIDEELSSTANKQWVALVIAHELAHQWFGNLVTMEWWNDLWLNEGFASFIEYLAVDHIFPKWDIWTQFTATELADAFALDSLKNTHPIEVEVENPAEISEIFDKVSYAKGASILRMLMSYLGPTVFQKGLQHYLKKHAYSNAKTEDLWFCLEKVSGKPVIEMMKNWTGKAGYPVISVKRRAQSAELELTQSRFFSSEISKKESKDRTIWQIPFKVSLRDHEVAKQSSTEWVDCHVGRRLPPRNDEVFLMDKETINIPGLKDDEWIKLNAGETSLVRVDYPHDLLKKLESVVKAGKLSAPDRLGLIRDSFDLAQSGNSPTTLALELALSYKDEADYTVWSVLTGQLGKLDSLLADEHSHENFKSYGREIYSGIAKKMGWEQKSGEKHTDALLRGMILYQLGHFGDVETIKKARELFSSSFVIPLYQTVRGNLYRSRIKSGMTQDVKIDPDLRSVVYNLVAENGGQGEFNALLKMYKKEDNQQEKDRIGRSLGLFKPEAILENTLDFAISKFVRYQNSLQIIASVWGNPEGRYLAWEFVKEHWKLLKERYAGGHYFTRVFASAGEFTKAADAEDIEKFTAKNPVPEAKRTITQVLEQIYSNAEWLRRDREKIRKFLKRFEPIKT